MTHDTFSEDDDVEHSEDDEDGEIRLRQRETLTQLKAIHCGFNKIVPAEIVRITSVAMLNRARRLALKPVRSKLATSPSSRNAAFTMDLYSLPGGAGNGGWGGAAIGAPSEVKSQFSINLSSSHAHGRPPVSPAVPRRPQPSTHATHGRTGGLARSVPSHRCGAEHGRGPRARAIPPTSGKGSAPHPLYARGVPALDGSPLQRVRPKHARLQDAASGTLRSSVHAAVAAGAPRT